MPCRILRTTSRVAWTMSEDYFGSISKRENGGLFKLLLYDCLNCYIIHFFPFRNKYQFSVFRCLAFSPTLRSTTVFLYYFRTFYWITFTEFRNFKFYLFFKIVGLCNSVHLGFLKLEAEGHFFIYSIYSYLSVYSKGLFLDWGCQSKPAKLYWYPTELLLLIWLYLSPSFPWLSHGVSYSKVSKFLVSSSCFKSGLNGAAD